jgi:hypothetical protein
VAVNRRSGIRQPYSLLTSTKLRCYLPMHLWCAIQSAYGHQLPMWMDDMQIVSPPPNSGSRYDCRQHLLGAKDTMRLAGVLCSVDHNLPHSCHSQRSC